MKPRIAQVFVFGMLALTAGNRQANASTISFVDTFDPSDTLMSGQGTNALCSGNNTLDLITPSGSCKSLTWTHTLSPFDSLTQQVTSAALAVTLYDNDTSSAAETFKITFDIGSLTPAAFTYTAQGSFNGTNAGTASTTTYNSTTLGSDYSVFLQMLVDGQIAIRLQPQATAQDFYFAKSVLTAESSARLASTAPQATPVPEPATLGLLGLGLVGIASKARARLRRN